MQGVTGGRNPCSYSRWYGCPVSRVAARYSCSASTTCASACGSVRAERRRSRTASFLVCASSPSGPPITKAMGADSRIQRPSCAASCAVVRSRPRSSSATRRAPLGTRGMRSRYWSRASRAQPRSLAPCATRTSFATLDPALRRELHRLVAPELFQVVVTADRGVHHVNHDVAQVHQHPFAARVPFDAVHALAERAQPVLDVVGERLHLAAGIAAGDHHALEEGRELRDVEHHDVAALHVLEGVDHGTLLLADVHQRYRLCCRM